MEHLDRLSPKIRALWEALGRTGPRYVLVGGAAIALRLGHRQSVNVELATGLPCEDPDVLRRRWADERLGPDKWIRRKPDHYIKFFATDDAPKIDVHGQVTGGCLDSPETASNGMRIASPTDLLRQKLAAMCTRGEARDGFDAEALLLDGRADRERAVAAVHQESLRMGPGPIEAHGLGQRLTWLSRSPWADYAALADLVPLLKAAWPTPPRRASEWVHGPEAVASLRRGRNVGRST